MSIVYSKEDRIPIEIDSIIIKISPLTALEKADIQPHLALAMAGDQHSAVIGAQKAIKYSVKELKGVKTYGGKDYSLRFDDNGNLTDDCVDEILNLQQNNKIAHICSGLIAGIPSTVIDPVTGEEMIGVNFIQSGEEGLG